MQCLVPRVTMTRSRETINHVFSVYKTAFAYGLIVGHETRVTFSCQAPVNPDELFAFKDTYGKKKTFLVKKNSVYF